MTTSDTAGNPLGVLTDVAACLAFMTRLELAIPGLDAARPIGHSAWALSLTGAFMGAIAGSAYAIATGFAFGPALAAVLAVAAVAIATGALPECGLAATADAAAGEPAPDARLGATGATALILVTFLRVATVAALDDVAVAMAAMMAALALGGAATAGVLYFTPPAGQDKPPAHNVLVAAVIAVAIALAILPFGGFAAVIIVIVAGVGLVAAYRRWVGTATAAAVGAVRLVCETAALLAIAASA